MTLNRNMVVGLVFFLILLIPASVHAANIELQTPEDGETLDSQPSFHWHDDDHADWIKSAGLQLARSPKTDINGYFTDSNRITINGQNCAKTINDITEVTVDLASQTDDSGNPVKLEPGTWYWHAMDTYLFLGGDVSTSNWSDVRSFTVSDSTPDDTIIDDETENDNYYEETNPEEDYSGYEDEDYSILGIAIALFLVFGFLATIVAAIVLFFILRKSKKRNKK